MPAVATLVGPLLVRSTVRSNWAVPCVRCLMGYDNV
jgi:hypothetical protein